MKLYSINTGYFKLDGGAMFGVVPKVIWQKINPSDEKNLCSWAMRSLLVQTKDHLILIDTGMGNKQSDKFFSYYEPHGDISLMSSLANAGFQAGDITDVLMTHLHFDHCGGSVIRDEQDNLVPAFPNATYWSHTSHWDWAMNPNAREKASFLKENFVPLQEQGVLKFVDETQELFPGFRVMLSSGHTECMMIPLIEYKDKTIAYMADLLPSAGHIPMPYIMSYDVRPLETLEEKKRFLKTALKNNYILFFEHDLKNECSTLQMTERGIRAHQLFDLKSIV